LAAVIGWTTLHIQSSIWDMATELPQARAGVPSLSLGDLWSA